MRITVKPAPIAEKPLIANLIELYIYDFSEFMGWDTGDDGRFGYRYLDAYWEEPARHPFVIRVEDKIAGFALVREQGPEGKPGVSMAEFFVMRNYRRKGVGETAATALFGRFPGRWHVSQLESNAPAQQFWRTVIGAYTGGNYTETMDDGRLIQTFMK